MQVLSGLRVGLLAIAALLGAASVANADERHDQHQHLQGRIHRGRLGRQRRADVPGPQLSAVDRGIELRLHLRRLGDALPWHRLAIFAARRMSPASTPKAAPALPPWGGAQAVVLANQSGAVLTLTGEQNGLIVSLDLSGLALALK